MKPERKRRLWWAGYALLYTALSFVLMTGSQLWTGQLNDSDDYMRLARVMDLLNGQGWYDLTVPRLDPGSGFALPWSRLLDLPLAGIILLLEPLLGRLPAAGIAAFFAPLLLLGLFCLIAPQLGRGLVPSRRGWLLIVVLFCSVSLFRELRPMRVDHHGAQLFCAMAALTLLLRYQLLPRGRWLALAGVMAGLGLAIGAEAFFWVALTLLYLGFCAAWRGSRTARHAPAFAGGLLFTLMLAMPLLRPPAEWLGHDLALPALPHLLLAVLALAVLLLVRAGSPQPRWRRMLMLAGAGLGGLGLLLLLIPELRAGIYGTNMSDDNRRLVLGKVTEALPLLRRMAVFNPDWEGFLRFRPMLGSLIVLPLAGTIIVLTQLALRRQPRRAFWLLHAAFLLPAVVVALIWQSRVANFANLYALAPVAWLFARLLQRCGAVRPPALRRLAQAGIMLLLPAATVWLADGALGARPAQLALFPSRFIAKPCDLTGVAALLRDRQQFGAAPLNIMTSMTGGTELLFRTPHRVFSAPYDVMGNEVAQEFFSTRDTGAARMVAQMHGVQLVLLCAPYASHYFPDDEARSAYRLALAFRQEGAPVPRAIDENRIFADRLLAGDVPPWLEPVPLPPGNMRLYRVRLPDGPGAFITP